MTFQFSEAQIVLYVLSFEDVGFRCLVAFYAVSSTWQGDINEVLWSFIRQSLRLAKVRYEYLGTSNLLHPISWNTLKIIIEDKFAYGLGSEG